MVNTPLFQLENLSHRYSSGLALDGISLQLDAGKSIGLLGCNGAGKSTLLYILAGLLAPAQGTLSWCGQPISPEILKRDDQLRQAYRRQVALQFQDPDIQWLCDSVLDEVSYGPRQVFPAAECEARVHDALQIMGIPHLAQLAPFNLSGGEKRRVCLASAIALDPDVLLLDEPTASLDATTTDFLVDWLQEYRRRPGKSLILASHDLDLVAELTDEAVVLTPCHRLSRFGLTSEILADQNHLRQMNLLRRRGAVSASQPKHT